ncbi:MAG: aminotransferase class I/II-fold pyridoxal phosphate-dependent enzyme [Deltaproteobacteria bacterium]|nr:aminotransferase class I/II-fold pyridoxal phosphate-dependent enzyme [Deltaproteobacteria bacterium]
MGRTEHFRISHTRAVEGTYRHVTEMCDAGLVLQTGSSPNGRHVGVDGKQYLSFGSCSYLSLETRPELRQAAHDAIDRWGTQFSISRVYVQCALYEELEACLAAITGRPTLVAASTSLAHMAALPVLVEDGDSVVVDQFAHASLHTALRLVPTAPLEILRHNRMDLLDAALTRLAPTSKQIWYVADGLYSMLGDFADFEGLRRLLDAHPKLRLYVDDAHATSWSGARGRGITLEHFASDPRVVVALSLNKAFSAAGGALAVASEALKLRIRRAGATMLFSGPIQPPMLGAAVGSARLHLSEEFPGLQRDLSSKIAHAARALERHGLVVGAPAESPIFQLHCDSVRMTQAICSRMRDLGFYTCAVAFPAVPVNRPGIRFTICRHNLPEDIDSFVAALAEAQGEAKARLGRSAAKPALAAALPD